MHTVSIFNAKTHLSRLVDELLAGKEDAIVVSRHGKPVVRIVPFKGAETGRRIGIAKGRFKAPDNIDVPNAAIAALFAGDERP